MPRPTLLLALLPLALSAGGCSKVREISACRAIVHEVNGALDEVEKLAAQKPVDEPRIARRYGELAKALAPRAQGESALAAAVRDYVAILQATQAAVQAHAAAAGTPSGRVAEPRRELDKLVKRERAAAARIESECRH